MRKLWIEIVLGLLYLDKLLEIKTVIGINKVFDVPFDCQCQKVFVVIVLKPVVETSANVLKILVYRTSL